MPDDSGLQSAAHIVPRFNRKVTDPSRHMHPSDGHRYRCPWIEDSITIHSDGNVTCGVDDPHGQRSFGNINRQSVAEIFANPEYEQLRRKLHEGHRCVECDLYQRVPDDAGDTPPRPRLPLTMVVEPTVRCNIRCAQHACIINNDPALRTRDADMLDPAMFHRAVDEVAGHLRSVYFFNYGDPFVHARAEDMLAHLHRACPDVDSLTTTNGIPLAKPERARRVVESGLGAIVFTIGGITQESYSRYHAGGRADLALRGMINVLQARRELGARTPVVHWRYLLFPWNDSDAEIEAALRLAEEHGVDDFALYLTHVPDDGISFRFSPGSPNFARYRRYMSNSFGYTRVVPEPDRDGFYALEQTMLGPARWTSWQARRRLPVSDGRARIAVTTSRPTASERPDHVFVITPWQRIKVPLEPMAWRCIELAVPAHLPLEEIEVELVTFDHWFPAEEAGSRDIRCLGVLVREDRMDEPAWRDVLPPTEEDTARLARFRRDAQGPVRAGASREADGLHPLEYTSIGPARWTGPQARKRLRVQGHKARIAVSTGRLSTTERAEHVFLVTPWEILKVPLRPRSWRSVEITVPGHLQLDEVEVTLVTFDHWVPSEELGGDDRRRLGVLVREDWNEEVPWTGFVPLTERDESRLADFRYSAPAPLVDDYAGRNLAFESA